MPATEIPLFPLNTVLFPGGVLPLRIFEPRYLDMVKRCMREASVFGVVLIRSGLETDSRAVAHAVGTMAQIVDFDQLSDGMLGIVARGTRRFKVLDSKVNDDGLQVAQIELLPLEPSTPLPEEFHGYSTLLQQALPQLGNFFKHLEPRYDDASWLSGRLAEVLPIPLGTKQRLLEIDAPLERLQVLQPLMLGEIGRK
jgi:uncharacterized protein